MSNLSGRSELGGWGLGKETEATASIPEVKDEPFLGHHALRRQAENVQSAIANETKVGRGSNCYARVEERRVLHRVSIEALGPILEHD